MRTNFLIAASIVIALNVLALFFAPWFLLNLILTGPVLLMGFQDFFQKRQTIRRNFPFMGRFRYWFEAIRPEINQYFVESNTDGVPFNREQRSVVYQRSKRALDTLPFGTQRNVYQVGYEWLNHSLMPVHVEPESLRVTIGGPDCRQKYSASLLNISAMSYGSLSKTAVEALNGGAKLGDFAHNTGEGGPSPYHLSPGGDLIWQIGTGYFGCRTPEGDFCEEKFQMMANRQSIKMIEIKLSQGAKPAHGGILPGRKVTKEISEIRGVPMGKDVISPPAHTAFSTPVEMLQFIAKLRNLSGGKPVGIKLCLGKRREFVALAKAMLKTGVTPDFIAVDGAEGGTGAAPLEFTNHVGFPGTDGLIFVHNILKGFGLRDRIKIIAAGKVTTAFGMIKKLALGADLIYAARAFMLALGCIQALRCNANICPAGVATQDPELVAGLVAKEKIPRIHLFHAETMESLAHLLGAMGVSHSSKLRAWNIMQRVSPSEVKNYSEIYNYLEDGALLGGGAPPKGYEQAFLGSVADSFQHTEDLAVRRG